MYQGNKLNFQWKFLFKFRTIKIIFRNIYKTITQKNKIIIESLIRLTKHSTKSAYDSLLSGQIETSKSQSGNFNEDES